MELEHKSNYQSPTFEFEALMLTERVADKCWGYAYAWYDADDDGKIEGAEKVQLSSLGLGATGCQGSAARSALIDYFRDTFGVTLSDADVSTNTKSNVVFGSNS